MTFRFQSAAARVFAGAGILATVLLSEAQSVPQAAPAASARDYPAADQLVWMAERAALLRKAAQERRVDTENVAAVIGFLAEDRGLEAVSLARDAARAQPARIAEIAKALTFPLQDRSNGLREALEAAIAEMRIQLKGLPGEEAARAARATIDLEMFVNLDRSRPGTSRLAPLRAFAQEFAGTEAGELAEVDVIESTPDNSERLRAALDSYARNHPGTVAAAKALYLKAEHIEDGPREGEPIDRFMSVVKIVEELESGRFPSCEWVTRASSLVTGFSTSWEDLSPKDLDRVIDTYKQFLLRHPVDDNSTFQDEPPYLLTSRLPEILQLKGGPNGVERILDQLERESSDPDAIRYMRARFDFIGGGITNDEAARLAVNERSYSTLEEISSHADSPWRQRALAALASQQFQRRHYPEALAAYRRYLPAFPQTEWSWLAAVRMGQAQAELGSLEAARETLRAAAQTYASRPVAKFVSLAFASQASRGLGDFDAELADLKLTLAAWDPAFGTTFVLGYGSLGAGFGPDVLSETLKRATLADRVASLPALLANPNGKELEIARWRMRQADWEGALSIFDRISNSGPLSREALPLARRARLELALTAADESSASFDESRADRELQALIAGPADINAAAAHIARAALAWRHGKTDDARQWMRAGLEVWRLNQPIASTPAKSSLASDTLEIRDAVFRPVGGAPYPPGHFASELPVSMPPYLLAQSSVEVKLPGGVETTVAVNRPSNGLTNMLFLEDDQQALLGTLMTRLTGAAAGTQIPSQPAGPSLQVLTLINEFITVRRGNLFGWQFLAYPLIRSIEFQDESRLKAVAAVVAGYSGADVLLEKRDGVWVVTAVTNLWVA